VTITCRYRHSAAAETRERRGYDRLVPTQLDDAVAGRYQANLAW
jgi:hypothetical protein